MTDRKAITYRESRITVVILLLVITPLVCLALYSLSAGQFAAVLFLLVLIGCTFFIVYSGTVSLSLKHEGIS